MIQQLPKEVVEKIAAGEVVTSVTSVVKELVENSIDAGSSEIEVRISSDCLALEVADNGCGIEEDDFSLLCERHCTSKLRSLKDLESISMYGFRGEALASISLCSKVTVESNHSQGFEARYTEGKLVSLRRVGVRRGTRFVVSDLFYNNKARRAYFSHNREEVRNVLNLISIYSVFNYKIRFSVYIDDNCQEKFKYKSSGAHIGGESGILEAKKDALKYFYNIKHELICRAAGRVKVIFSQLTLHLKRPVFILFVNKRLVESRTVKSELLKVYSNIIPRQRFPLIYIELELNSQDVDVNVHPSKKEVLFSEMSIVAEIKKIITSALETQETLVVPCSPGDARHDSLLQSMGDTAQSLSAGSNPSSALKIYSCPLNSSLDSLSEYRKSKVYKLVSIQRLADEIKEEDPAFFKSLTYVGHAGDRVFVQHGMYLLLCNFKELKNVFFYQNFVIEFGNFERRPVEAADSTENACMDQLSAAASKLSENTRNFLDDYFCIRVFENSVESLPTKFGIEVGVAMWADFIAFVSEQILDDEMRVFRAVLTRLAAMFSQAPCDERKLFHVMKKKMVGTREAFANFTVLTTLKELYRQFERC